MPGVLMSTASTGSVVSVQLVGSGGAVLEGGSVVVIGDVGLIGVTPGLVSAGTCSVCDERDVWLGHQNPKC